MGGALAVHTALTEQVEGLIGLVVVDVVEGTAMDALSSMQGFLRGRPKTFPTLEYAIEWSLRSGQVRNTASARVSMAGQLKNSTTNKCAVFETTATEKVRIMLVNSFSIRILVFQTNSEEKPRIPIADENAITEEEEEEDKNEASEAKQFKTPENPEAEPVTKSKQDSSSYNWRIDLGQTEPHWRGWFSGLSSKFLSVSAAKMLVLAGVDRLDKDLTVGQMQGKFQMQVLPQAGHAVHEDVPEKMSEILATFLVRNKFAEATSNFSPTFPAC